MKEYKTIKIKEREEGIAIITLCRPYRLNAWNFQFLEEMIDCLNYLHNSVEIRVLIITGEGRAFSSGLDLKDHTFINLKEVPDEFKHIKYLQMKDPKKRNIIFQDMLGRMIIKLRQIPQPVISAVKGPAYGGGFALAMASDIRIAGESAVFCNAFINIGVSGADCGSTYWLTRLIGFSRAAEIIYTGREVLSEEAYRIGLVLKVVPDNKILEESLKIAEKMLEKSYMGLRLTKEALNANIDAPSLENAIKLENQIQNTCGMILESGLKSDILKNKNQEEKN
ncbi:MAG: enoyl-CoA hydratase/isomerase family protein [Promethearchaeota archaeon]